ncbi:MAG: PD40 domain-containing protein, partial [Blastocatellia bacterium]|nr:PD40 domain-containing protein [Blastocatellia bacterium]
MSVLIIASILTYGSSGASSASQKRLITQMDLFKFVWIADPQISPDGSRVAFVRVWVNQKADRYDSALWIAPTGGGAPRQLTAGSRDASPRWSPDGKRLAFVRSTEKDGRPQPPQIYLLTFDGGEAQALTDLPRGGAAPQWSPDGKTIAFIGSEDLGKKDDAMTEGGEVKEKQPEHVSDVRVITRGAYRSNGPGYLNPKVKTHVWTVSAFTTPGAPGAPGESPKPKRITKGNFDEGAVSWSPDGKRIYFTANRDAEPY